ncbi:MAG: hypothetical protein LBE56_01945 [Tannerella sp.]|jgi:hypothetical protein|nr:hypothetical protein [Tannerella sp.]
MIRRIVVLLFLCGGTCFSVLAQKFVWKAGMYNFFENNEFANSRLQIPQTMAGVHLAPQIGLQIDGNQRIFAGFDAMHEYGSNEFADFLDPIAYYEFQNRSFRFYAGAFPRKAVLDRYPRIFFRDSINNYLPTVNGIFWEYREDANFFNVWLDWVSRQTVTRREAFFVGWSGRYNIDVLYGQHIGYMMHYAKTKQVDNLDHLYDNILTLTSLGIDLSHKTNFEQLEANVGWVFGLEQDRDMGDSHHPQGFLSELKVEYKGLELFNTFYKGKNQQVFRNVQGSALYWGEPMYQSSTYDRADLSVLFYKSDAVNLKLTWSLHFAESTVYYAQLFTATVELDNLGRKKGKRARYLWDNLLK